MQKKSVAIDMTRTDNTIIKCTFLAPLPFNAKEIMAENDKEDWKRWVNPKIYPLYEEMRERLMAVEVK